MSTEIAIKDFENDIALLDFEQYMHRFQFGEEFEIVLYDTTFFTLKHIWMKDLVSKVEKLRKYAEVNGYWCGCSVDVIKRQRRYTFNKTGPLLLTGPKLLPGPEIDIEEQRKRSYYEFMNLTED